MSAILQVPPAGRGSSAQVWAAWRSLRWNELGWFTLMGFLYGLIELSGLAYVEINQPWLLALLRQLLSPVVVTLVLMLFWLPVERSDRDHVRRPWRLALATLLGSMAAMLVLYPLARGLDWPSINELMRLHKGQPPHSGLRWNQFIGDSLSAFLPSILTVVLFELLERRRRTQARLQQLLHEQSVMARHAMASRLAVMQAQVEPQFLFDGLVDIEQAYARDEAEAPVQMERLIRHLRVALPRLRESGGSLESEAELLDSYLAVVAGRRKTEIRFSAHWPPELRGSALPPMLLLPLAQRALRLATQAPSRCSLTAASLPDGGLRLALSFDRPGLCGADTELQALSERLRALSGEPAELRCSSSPDGTLFTLELKP